MNLPCCVGVRDKRDYMCKMLRAGAGPQCESVSTRQPPEIVFKLKTERMDGGHCREQAAPSTDSPAQSWMRGHFAEEQTGLREPTRFAGAPMNQPQRRAGTTRRPNRATAGRC